MFIWDTTYDHWWGIFMMEIFKMSSETLESLKSTPGLRETKVIYAEFNSQQPSCVL